MKEFTIGFLSVAAAGVVILYIIDRRLRKPLTRYRYQLRTS